MPHSEKLPYSSIQALIIVMANCGLQVDWTETSWISEAHQWVCL